MHAEDAGPATGMWNRGQGQPPRGGGPWIGALALAALLTGAGAGGSAWLALTEMDARARAQAARSLDEAFGLMRVAELAAGLSSNAAEMESADTALRRQAAHNALHQRMQQLDALLDALPWDRRAELRVTALDIRAEADELNATVARRLAVERSLQELTEQVAGRSEALAAALAKHHAPLPDGELLRRVDDARLAVALRLIAAGTAPVSAAAPGEFRKAAAALFDALDDLPIAPDSPRRADTARQLVALGLDQQNVFELRREQVALTDKAVGTATLLRGTAMDLANLASRGALALRDGLRDGTAPVLHRTDTDLVAAVSAGIGLAVFAVGLGTVRLHARRKARPDPVQPALPDAPSDRPSLRILLAEDEPISQRTTAALLSRAGHETTVVGDGRAALAAVERDRYDLVLMDMQMPEMDGVEAIRRIRALPDTTGTGAAGLRIVALTASAVPGAAELCRAAGADAVLEKPLRLSSLAALLDRLSAGPDAAPAPPDQDSGLPTFDEDAIRQMRDHLPADRVATLVTNTLVTLRGYHAALEQAWNAGDRATTRSPGWPASTAAGRCGAPRGRWSAPWKPARATPPPCSARWTPPFRPRCPRWTGGAAVSAPPPAGPAPCLPECPTVRRPVPSAS